MSNGLNNSKIGMELFLQIVDQYKKFIGGGGSNQNLFSFIEGREDYQKEIQADLLKNIQSEDPKEKEKEEIKRNIMFPLLDNMQFAYSIQDIISGNAFPNTSLDSSFDLSKFLYIAYEDAAKQNLFDSTLMLDDGSGSKKATSVINMVTPIKTKYQQKPVNEIPGFEETTKKSEAEDKKKKVAMGNFALPTFEADSVYVNGGDANGSPSEGNRYSTGPNLSAFVIRKPDLGITSRNADPINIFFNAIPPLEMSRCVPYINVAVVTLEDELTPKKVNNVTFMRFIEGDAEKGFRLDENIGLQRAKPYDAESFGTLFNDNKFDDNMRRDVSLMDIFTSPQMMSNANVNDKNQALMGTGFGNHILEPISPFLTLNSVSVDISGMGIALFSSKVASMELTLHDRSRLSDVSSLVAPNQFGMTKIILEFGWSHPDGNYLEETETNIGKFLNSARDRSIYTVKSSNFSFSDGNTVKISLSLSCYGADESKSISAAAGSKIPLSIFKPTIERIMDTVVEKKLVEENKTKGANLKHREIRHIINVSQRNINATDSLITYEKYIELINLYSKSLTTETNNASIQSDFFKNLSSLVLDMVPGIQPTEKETEEKAKEEKYIPTEMNKDATELLFGKLYALTENLPEELAHLKLDPLKNAVCDFAEDGESANGMLKLIDEGEKSGYVSLGKVFMSFIGHSLAMSGLFDEVQMFFYPLNVHAGAARSHTTASMLISKSKLVEVLSRKIASDSSLSVNSIFNLIERKIIRDNSCYAYGLNSTEQAYKENQEAIEKLKEEYAKLDGSSSAAKTKKETILDRQKLAREQRKEGISTLCATYYLVDNGPPVEPKFVRPNLSLFIETLSSSGGEAEDVIVEKNLKDFKKYQKNVCRVHIYDEESVSKPFESFLNSMITEGSGGRAVVKSINDEYMNGKNDPNMYLKAKENKAELTSAFKGSESLKGKLLNYTLTVHPSAIKSAIKRGYPSITYGTSNGTIKNINVSSNVSNNVSQVIMISSNANKNNPQGNQANKNNLEEMKVVPSTVSVEMVGNPFIQRGNQIYIDFGTNTTLDNIYTVKSVKHSLSAGEFSTSVDLIYAGQGEVSSIRDKIAMTIDAINS